MSTPTASDREAIRKAIGQLSFGAYLKPAELDQLVEAFEKTSIKKGETLIYQGKTGELFYVLGSGRVSVWLKGSFVDKLLAHLEPPAFFGEMALLSNTPRTATVVCEEDGEVFTLLRATFRTKLLENRHVADLIRRTAEERLAAIQALEDEEWKNKRRKDEPPRQ
jgi:NTE family protein